MTKKHPGKQFMLGVMIGSTVAAVSALVYKTKTGKQIQKAAIAKYHELEHFVKGSLQKQKTKFANAVKRQRSKMARKVTRVKKAIHRLKKRA